MLMVPTRDRRQGSTPTTVTVESGFSHSVEVTYVGYNSYSTYASPDSGETSYVYAELVPVPAPSAAYLSISSSPSGASVYVDGSYQGQSPITVSVSTGSHSVSLEYSDYYTWSGTASVASGQTTSVYASMTHKSHPAPTNVPTYVPNPVVGSGDLYITSDPSLADVYVDNAYKGLTPITITADGGYHTVRIESSGYSGSSNSVGFAKPPLILAAAFSALCLSPSSMDGAPVPLFFLLICLYLKKQDILINYTFAQVQMQYRKC